MRISIVVPAFNEERLFADSLRSMRCAMEAFAERGWPAELIVCDNNSDDRTAELAQAAGARVVFEPVNQIARARNKGAEAASGDWLLFIDADSHPQPELLADVVAAIESGRYLAGGSSVRLDASPLVGRLLVSGWNLLSRCTKLLAGSLIF